jgi:transcriptional regulator with XRE-family HTH domain
MTGKEFKLARKKLGWSQCDVAARLGVSQTYVALLEHGKRHFSPRLARRAVSLLRMSPTALPLSLRSSKETELVRQLSALGYPGYAHVPPVRRRNPAEVLLVALGKENLDARVVEALPWLLLRYGTMSEVCKTWMVEQARLRGLTNRLGFTVTLAKEVAERNGQTASDSYRALAQLEQELFRSRLAEPDTFCQNDLSQGQREWMADARPEAARQWNLLTNWSPEDLQYAQSSFALA